jgi:transcription elongation factor GreA-like protein
VSRQGCKSRKDLFEAFPGREVVIVEDDTNLPLTDEEKSVLSRAFCDQLQEGAKFAEVWSRVVRACPQIAGERSVNQLVEAYECLRRQVSAAVWQNCVD